MTARCAVTVEHAVCNDRDVCHPGPCNRPMPCSLHPQHVCTLRPCFTQISDDRTGWECRPTPEPRYPWRCQECGQLVELSHRVAIERGLIDVMDVRA